MEGEKEPYHTLMSQLGKHTKNVKAATILAAAKKRRECVCVCLFADKKTSFHTIDVTVIYNFTVASLLAWLR